jgi:hypothetical protein
MKGYTMNRKLVITLLLLIAVLAVSISPAIAHERREVEGYQLVFGWRSEPALVGVFNGPELFVYELTEDGERGDPVSGLADGLSLEISFGPASRTLTLREAFGDPGHYIADLIPTRPGDYSFHVTGTINDVGIDEVFTSADGEFGSVEPASDIMFPDETMPTIQDLQAQIDELRAIIEALQAG